MVESFSEYTLLLNGGAILYKIRNELAPLFISWNKFVICVSVEQEDI